MSSLEDIPGGPIPELSMEPVFDSDKKKPTEIELTEEKKKEFEAMIAGVNDFATLFQVIDEIRKVDETFCPNNMLDEIREINKNKDRTIIDLLDRQKTGPLVAITRKYGLRSKVIELVAQFPRK